jgi:hypothetical protein
MAKWRITERGNGRFFIEELYISQYRLSSPLPCDWYLRCSTSSLDDAKEYLDNMIEKIRNKKEDELKRESIVKVHVELDDEA